MNDPFLALPEDETSVEIKRFIDCPLVDLGSSEPNFLGVLAARYELVTAPGVTKQFFEEAQTYHQKYFDIGYTKWLVEGAIRATKFQHEPSLILDVGSGSGPSIFALLDIFSKAHIVATDVSPQLLAILRHALREKGKSSRCTTLCLDLNRRWFKGQPFDLAVGAAILHHLFEPQRLIEQVFSAIRPGGVLVFFEPFEPGYATMSLIYRLLLAQALEAGALQKQIADYFVGKIRAIAEMKCEPKDQIKYANIDDKWSFTKTYFTEIGERIGASDTIIYPINDVLSPFTSQMKTSLRLGLGLTPDKLPDWAWRSIEQVESSISEACKQDLILEGCVAFIK